MTLDDLVAARRARADRWNTFRAPSTAAEDIDRLRFMLDREIDHAQAEVSGAEAHLHSLQARLTSLLTRRDEHDALEAEVASLRQSQMHARYVEREPVVILPRVAHCEVCA